MIDSSQSVYSCSQKSNFSTEFFDKNKTEDDGEPPAKKFRGSVNIIDEKLVATLDKCLVSDRNAVRIITAVAEACGCDTSALIINRVSIQKYREKIRRDLAEKIRQLFPSTELRAPVLHWDGKLFRNISGKNHIDRLAIIIMNGQTEKLLSIPALEDGHGSTQARAIAEVI